MRRSVLNAPVQFGVKSRAPVMTRSRSEPRAAFRAPCELRLIDADGGTALTLPAETINISARGLALQVPQSVDHGATVEIVLGGQAGGDCAGIIRGAVIHQRRIMSGAFELGIRITDGAEGPGFPMNGIDI